MCGINGFVGSDKEKIEKMNEATKHRGPDGRGFFVDERVSIGHNLLAIIEKPENSRQPIVSHDGNYVLSYNGEIYNHEKLRNQLEQKGINFETKSDTEVLFQGLLLEGTDFVAKVDGMYAIAWYDKRHGKITLMRDRSGMKPMYYYKKDKLFVFSSELKGLFAHGVDRKLDRISANVYFTMGYVPGESTMIKNIYKVRREGVIVYDIETGEIKKEKLLPRVASNSTNDSLESVMHKSVTSHTMGLRPFGLYLSGGLDSTVILHELSKINKDLIKTFTTRFDTDDVNINEDANRAKRLAGDYNIDHNELFITQKDFIEATEATIATLEEPRYNFSVPAYWLLAKHASKDITVVLNGSGGDELFLGYSRYRESRKLSLRYERMPKLFVNFWHTLSAMKKGRIRPSQWADYSDPFKRWVYLNAIMPSLRTQIYKEAHDFNFLDVADMLSHLDVFPGMLDMENDIAELDRRYWLADEEFLRTDKIAMHFGMEGRFPFLANSVFDFAKSIPSSQMLKGETKSVVRNAYRGKLPDYVVDKRKTGWYAPVVEWMKSDYGAMVREVLSDGYYDSTTSLLNLEKLRKEKVEAVNEFTRGNIKVFMPVVNFQIWARSQRITI